MPPRPSMHPMPPRPPMHPMSRRSTVPDTTLPPTSAAPPALRRCSPPEGPQCPHCEGRQVQGHGSFPLRDGSRQPRYRCRTCGRTFNPLTRTPLAYLKLRDRWPRFARCMVSCCTVREAAAFLGVRPATAFAWRHRLLAPLSRRPQPALTGAVDACFALIRYSEKGSRRGFGRGAWGSQMGHGRLPYRHFIDGKPSCVLLLSGGRRAAAAIAGRAWPGPEEVQRCLAPLLGPGAVLYGSGRVPFAEACRGLAIFHREERERPAASRRRDRWPAWWLQSWLYRWLAAFRGVATRYLAHYLTWFIFTVEATRAKRGTAGPKLLALAGATLPKGRAA